MNREEYTQRQWNEYHKININNIVERICTQCGEWKEETENFYMQNKSKPEMGFGSWCKTCTIKKNNERNYENYDRMIASQIKYNKKPERKLAMRERSEQQRKDGKQAIWQRNNPEKIKFYSTLHRYHDITSSEERDLLKVFDYKCAYCGLTEEEHKEKFNQKLHNDHVDNKGYNDLRNDVPACGSCHYRKWAFPMEDWYREQEYFTEERLAFIIWWTSEGYKDYIEDKPPYKIKRKQNEDKKTFHYEL